MLKRTVSVVLLIVMLTLTATIPSFAVNTESERVSMKLRKIGLSTQEINNMDIRTRKEIAENAFSIASRKTVYYSVKGDDLVQTKNNISPMLSSSDLSLSVIVYNYYPTNNRERLGVYANWDWATTPFFTLKDCLGVSWDSSIWRIANGSFYKVQNWKYINDTFIETQTSSSANYASASGVGGNIDVKRFIFGSSVLDQWGYIYTVLEAQNTGSISGTSSIYANYEHATGSGSVGLTFDVLSVSWSGSAAHESLASWLNFTY
jgi:hypothetical protein